MNDSILLQNDDGGGVRTLTLNRPQSRNALSDALMHSLHNALAAAADDKSVRVVVINAAGAAFCAGHDLREMATKSGIGDYRQVFALCSRMMLAITHNPKPVIAEVRGMATAAGCQLVAACDMAFADETARFATPGVNIGLFCSTPMVALARNVGRKAAMKMLLTGDALTAAEAAAAGLINEVCPADELTARCQNIARNIAGKSMMTLATGKGAFYRQLEMPLAEAYQYAGEVMAKNMTAKDAQEGITAFLAKRPPKWQDE